LPVVAPGIFVHMNNAVHWALCDGLAENLAANEKIATIG
jgi:hypothetical protein